MQPVLDNRLLTYYVTNYGSLFACDIPHKPVKILQDVYGILYLFAEVIRFYQVGKCDFAMTRVPSLPRRDEIQASFAS